MRVAVLVTTGEGDDVVMLMLVVVMVVVPLSMLVRIWAMVLIRVLLQWWW